VNNDPCEYNPIHNRPALANEVHAQADVIVGAGNNNWRLCWQCASLPEFKKYRKRKAIIKEVQNGRSDVPLLP